MKPITASLAILLSVCCLAALGELSLNEQATAEKLYVELGRQGLSNYRQGSGTLTDEERHLVVELLRSEVDSAKRRFPKEAERLIQPTLQDMATLGDDWALTQCVSWFLAHESRGAPNVMRALKNPKVIPLIGEALFKEEKEEFDSDVGLEPTQQTVAQVIVYTLIESPEFEEDVRNWARRVSQNGTMTIIRDWYRLNETKLKAMDFKAVRPGAEPSELKQSAPVGTQATSPPTRGLLLPSIAKPLGNPPASGHFGNSYLLIGALLLAVCGCLVWLSRTKRE